MGGSAFDEGSAKEVKTAESKETPESENPSEQKNTAESAKPVENNNSKSNSGETNQTVVASNGEERSASIVRSSNTASPAAAPTATGASSTQSQAGAQQNAQITSSANNGSTANSDDTVWTRDDFNISADGKTIGLTGLNKTNGYPGLNAKGIAKLKKNHHLVIPKGVEVILNNSFIGHKTDDTFIEGITLPDSLKVIEDGAFSWQKIKGTVVIPKNVIAVHPAAFLGNEIEKVVFKSTLAETGKRNSTDDHVYYLAGLGNRAFQGNKIKEIEFTGNLTNYKFHVDSNEKQNPDAAPFSNQELDEITLTVGDEFKMPVTIKQNGNDYKILNMVLAGDKNNHGSLVDSGFFKEENGKIVAAKVGKIQTQCLFYDTVNQFRPVGTVKVTYNIIPMAKIYTITFVNDTDQNYAKVQVKENKSIEDKSVLNQSMPTNPSKYGYSFRGWNTKSDGTGAEFLASTKVDNDMTVYAIYTNYPPTLTLQDKTITEGDPLDLSSLVVSATDSEDGDLTSKVKLTNNGGFDNTKVGSYKITFSVTDNGGYNVTKSATVTVAKKPVPLTKLNIAPTLTLQDKTITEGDSLDLKTLVVSAQDPEDGDLTSKVKLTDNGGFDNTKVGSYKVTFSVTDSGKASITKSATVTVAEKPEEPIPDIDWDDIPTPDTEPIPTLTPILTPVPVPQLTPAPATPTPEQPATQPVSHTPAHAAKHLPQTGVSVASILAAAIASLFAGVASLGATSKRKHKTSYK